ncbi:MAG: hypothetical protein AAF657_36905 [Acidobacteriota bacterium]
MPPAREQSSQRLFRLHDNLKEKLMHALHSHLQRILFAALLILAVPLPVLPAVARGCGDAEPFTLSDTWRGFLTGSEEKRLRLRHRAEAVPQVLVVEVTRPLTTEVGVGEPLLTVCSDAMAENKDTQALRIDVLERSTTRQVLLVHSPSDIVFRVTSQDPSRPAGAVKVTAKLIAEVPFLKDTEEIEIEPETTLPHSSTVDHADAITFATLLEVPGTVTGEIANAWGDDIDVFAFDLSQERIVILETFGDTDTIGGLLDASGRLLAVDDDGGVGGNVRLVRALLPGRYFARVEGSLGAEGSYIVSLETVSW